MEKNFSPQIKDLKQEAAIQAQDAKESSHDSDAARASVNDAAILNSQAKELSYYASFGVTPEQMKTNRLLRDALEKAYRNKDALDNLGSQRVDEQPHFAGLRVSHQRHLENALAQINQILHPIKQN